jgi:uncharacterized membrane protein SpoIIM required for sporulation
MSRIPNTVGPILFLCFINDLGYLYTVNDQLTLMFADDAFSLQSGDDLDELNPFHPTIFHNKTL